MDRRGHRRPARRWQRAAAGVGDRSRQRTGVHAPQGSYSPATQRIDAALDAAGLRAPAVSRTALLGETVQYGHDGVRDRRACAAGTPATTSRSSASRARCTRSATTCSTACCRRSTGRARLRGAGDLADRAAVLGRRQPQEDAGGWRPADPSRRRSASCSRQFRRAAESAVLKAARTLERRRPVDGGQARRSRKAGRAVPGHDAGAQVLAWCRRSPRCDGMALGGGCEFIMHCDRAVAALESYIGLVEVGVGLLPAGGGCKEFAHARGAGRQGRRRVRRSCRRISRRSRWRRSSRARSTRARWATCAPTDRIVFNRYELLDVAKAEARALAEAGYRPPLRPRTSRSPAAPASRPSRCCSSTCATAASSRRTTT